jgi:hypothetical protein
VWVREGVDLLPPSSRNQRRVEMANSTRILQFSLVAAAAMVLAATAGVCAQPEEIELDEAEIFFEFNSTDLDLGLQIFWDGPGWEKVTVTGPDNLIFDVKNGRGLRQLGSAENFMESEEPELCPEDEEGECDLEGAMLAFQMMFPEGTYVFEGKGIDPGVKLVGSAELHWELPAPVVIIDAEGNFPEVVWAPAAAVDGNGVEVVGYEIVVEAVTEEDDEERVFTQVTRVTSDIFSITTSPEFVDMVDGFIDDEILVELKIEIIADGDNNNRTITEEVIIEEEE